MSDHFVVVLGDLAERGAFVGREEGELGVVGPAEAEVVAKVGVHEAGQFTQDLHFLFATVVVCRAVAPPAVVGGGGGLRGADSSAEPGNSAPKGELAGGLGGDASGLKCREIAGSECGPESLGRFRVGE
ncbi:MAG: hypothetical protein EXS38_06240 [Opitutus sp.]|nr:hypothetical protein [Opitutus sp.]